VVGVGGLSLGVAAFLATFGGGCTDNPFSCSSVQWCFRWKKMTV